MKLYLLAALLVSWIMPAVSQSFHFRIPKAYDQFDVRTDFAGHITCFYRVAGKRSPSIYRKVYLDGDLHPIDSTDYTVPGNATLVGNYSNDKYTVHLFLSKRKMVDFLYFLVLDQSGAVRSKFIKTASDFNAYFEGTVEKAKEVDVQIIDNSSGSDMLILRPTLMLPTFMNGTPEYWGQITAWNIEDGEDVWTIPGNRALRVLITEHEVITLTFEHPINGSPQTQLTLNFFNKEDGRTLRSQPLFEGNANRELGVMTTNGQQLMFAGNQPSENKTTGGHFYMSLFDMTGKQILDKVDTTERLSTKRMHLLGSAFDNEGNLFLIAEGYQNDYTMAAFITALSILGVVTGVGYAGIDTEAQHKVTSIVMCKINPEDGSVKDFYSFPAGSWMQESRLITHGSHVLIDNASRVLLYDPNQPAKAPAKFTSLRLNESLIIGPTGPLVIHSSRKDITIKLPLTD